MTVDPAATPATRAAAPRGADESSSLVATLWHRILAQPSALILANTALQSVMRMGSNIVLARLLAPSAFALVALTTLILTGMQMISDMGIGLTALREGAMSREDEHKLWTMQFVRGFAIAAVALLAAGPVGWITHDRQLGAVLAAFALMPILMGAQSLYPVMALGQRRLLPTTLLELGSRTIAIVGSVLVALLTPTVWSLVIGTLASFVFSTVGSFVIAGYRPRFVLDRAYIAKQWQFARWIQMASTLSFLGTQVDKPLFPILFGMTTLGLYGIGAAFAGIPAQITMRWITNVFYPLTTQLLRNGAEARALLLRVRITMLLYTAVMAVAMIAVAPAFFMLLYKPQYWAAARFAQILALAVFFDTAESSLRHMPLVDATPRYEVSAMVVRMVGFAVGLAGVIAFKGDAFAYAMSVVFGGLAALLYMLSVCTRRGYVRPLPDLAFIAVVLGATAALYAMPAPAARPFALIGWGAGVGIVGAVAMLVIYRRRGLPSLPAEPAPSVLREVAAEEMGLRPEPV